MHRTSFLRQAANLWVVKHRLSQHLLAQVRRDRSWMVASAAVPICRFAGA